MHPLGHQGPFCLMERTDETRIERKECKVELEDGVEIATAETKRCRKCLFPMLPDGKARGVIFHS